MTVPPTINLELGDVLQLRKTHPCGSREWQVVRLGADIGLRCLTCGRRVLIPRAKLARQIKSITSADREPAAQE